MTKAKFDHPLSSLVKNMSESETLKMAQKARDLTAAGRDVISLSLGEPDFDTPDHIKAAAKIALEEGYTKYTPVAGLAELRKAIVQKFQRDNQLDFSLDQIVVSNGAKQSIANVCLALLNPGDEVLVFSPYWVSYWEIIKMAGGIPVPVHADIKQDFKPTPTQIAAKITEKTKLIIFSSPCNPTGSVFSRKELGAIADMLSAYERIHIISDEIYEYINFTEEGHSSIGSFEAVMDRTITINGFSKGFAMTGWRLGYMGVPAWLANACAKIQGQFTSGATAFGQKAAAYALQADMKPTRDMCEAFEDRKALVINLLSEIPNLKLNNPQGAFYIFPDVSQYFGKSDGTSTIRDANDFCTYVLENAYVGIVTGNAFGDPNCFRLSYAAGESQLKEAIKRMKKVLQNLK